MPITHDLPNNSPFMTVPQAAKFCGVSKEQMYAMCNKGIVKSYRMGNAIRVNRAALFELTGTTEADYLAYMAG